MYAAALPSEARSQAAAAALKPIRVEGGVRATFGSSAERTRLAHLAEHGGYRMAFPRTHSAHAEGVIVNTGGGVVGGDRVVLEVRAKTGADVSVTTQAAERIYWSAGAFSEIHVRLKVETGAQLAWMPQETILFSGARLKRRIEVDIAEDATVLLTESTVFGRIASGEAMLTGQLRDIWRVRRGGRLVFCETARIEDVTNTCLARPAVLGGATAVALLAYVGPEAEARLRVLREAMQNARSETGASAWNGLLVMRCIAAAPEDMRHDVMRAIAVLSGAPLPRVWSM